jgi:hypothetical protein
VTLGIEMNENCVGVVSQSLRICNHVVMGYAMGQMLLNPLAAPINVSLGLVLMNQTNMVWCELIELRCLVGSYPETNAFLKKRKKCWHSIQG